MCVVDYAHNIMGILLLKIIVDYREKASGLIDLLKNEGGFIEAKKVSHGDYIINETITIERKTAKNFLISIIDGRLINQLSKLKKFCTNPILIIEGNPYRYNFLLKSPNTDIRANRFANQIRLTAGDLNL